jgi:mono/diheme cytochrome c family protein
MKAYRAVLILALAPASIAVAQGKEAAPAAPDCKVPEDAAKLENPVKPEAGSIGEGKRLFESQCALCHGKGGDGKGDLVEAMNLKVRNYRDPQSLKALSDGALFHILKKGCGQMLGEEGRLKDNQMWDMINYIRSLARKSEVAEKKEEPQQP